MEKFKGLIFDFNGVLLDDQHIHDGIWSTYAEKITGKKPSDAEFKNELQGRANKDILQYLYKRPLDPTELEESAREKELLYQKTARELGAAYQLADGATKLFQELKNRNIPYTIATSSPKMNVVFYSEMFHLETWFDMDRIAFVDGIIRGKPAPDLYLRGAEMLSLKPQECVVIEDARSGIAAAHAAGIGYIIAIGPKERHDELRAVESVDEVVERLSEVDVEKLFE